MVSEVGVFIAKRLPWAVLTIFFASLLSFSLLYFSPGNSAEMILSAEMGYEPTQEAVQSFMMHFGLDDPFISQYLGWISNILHGSFGTSLRTGDPVLEEFMARFPATFILALSALSFALIIGLSFGVLSAVKPNSWLDYLGNLIASTGIAIPSFWLGLLLIFFFSIHLNVLPSFGYGGLEHLILPTIALGSHQVARILRVTRESMLDVLGEEYIVFAYAKGLTEKVVIIRHAIRNALNPVVTQAGLDLGYLLGGTVIIEQVFGWPGIGSFLLTSVMGRDFPVVSGFVLIIAFLFVLVNLLVDLSYSVIDPRVKLEGAK